MNKITGELVTSAITVILAIFAIAIFIGSGGTLLFYGVVLVAIALGFYNAWLASMSGHGSETGKSKGRARSRRRRR